jgi:hypothetical protein
MDKKKKRKKEIPIFLLFGASSFDNELCLLRRLTHRHASCNKKQTQEKHQDNRDIASLKEKKRPKK